MYCKHNKIDGFLAVIFPIYIFTYSKIEILIKYLINTQIIKTCKQFVKKVKISNFFKILSYHFKVYRKSFYYIMQIINAIL